MSTNALYRTCPSTGLQYHKSAEMLMKANAVAGVVFLLIGGILALLVTLTRWPCIGRRWPRGSASPPDRSSPPGNSTGTACA